MAPPPILVPDDGCAPADRVFRPVDPASVPEIADVLAWLSAHAPDVIAAVADVDRSLIWAAMDRSPLDHLDDCARAIEDLTAFRARRRLAAR